MQTQTHPACLEGQSIRKNIQLSSRDDFWRRDYSRLNVTDTSYSALQIMSQEFVSSLNDPLKRACPGRHKSWKSPDTGDQ